MGAVGTWAGVLPQAPGEAQPREESGRLCGGWKGCACVRAYVHRERLNPGRSQSASVEAGKGVCACVRACVRVCVCAPGEAQPREESGRLCGGWKGCVCVCVCVCARARAMKMRP